MKIAVAGTGYVGLVAGVCFAEKGHDVTCVDVDAAKVKRMAAGESPIFEEGLEELMQKNNAAGRLHYTTDYAEAYRDKDAIFIGVGTPEQPDGSANLNYIATVSRQIAESVERDCLVVVKSTVPVGTNDKVEQFINDFLIRDVKVEVASNPEFLAQGSAVHDTLHAAHHHRYGEQEGGGDAEKDLRTFRFAHRLGEQAFRGDDQVRLQRFSGFKDFLYERYCQPLRAGRRGYRRGGGRHEL